MIKKLEGRRAIIIGGGGGIGGAIAQRFYSEGASVAVIDANEAAADKRAAELEAAVGDGQVFCKTIDIGDPGAAEKAVEETAAAFGGLDISVHSAASRDPTAVTEHTEIENWDEALRVNLTSMFLLCKYAIPHLRNAGGGVIINIASQLGSVVTPGRFF